MSRTSNIAPDTPTPTLSPVTSSSLSASEVGGARDEWKGVDEGRRRDVDMSMLKEDMLLIVTELSVVDCVMGIIPLEVSILMPSPAELEPDPEPRVGKCVVDGVMDEDGRKVVYVFVLK